MEIKVRKLKYSDRVKLSELIVKLVDVTGDDSFLKMISSTATVTDDEPEGSNPDDNLASVGLSIIKKLFLALQEETKIWFCDLTNISVEDFNENAPFDVEVQIVNQIIVQDGVISFFTGASQLFNKIKKLQDKLSKKKEKSGS